MVALYSIILSIKISQILLIRSISHKDNLKLKLRRELRFREVLIISSISRRKRNSEEQL